MVCSNIEQILDKMKKKHVGVIFPEIKNLGKRSWGSEDLLVLIPGLLSLKRIKIKKGSKGGLQYHHKKNECGYLVSGNLIIRYDDGNKNLKEKILKPGSTFHFPPGAIHQEEAITDCEVIEASSPHFNDRVRVEEEYGMSSKEGLPSTSEDEIKFKE
jgi:mannose-6-phosphate isomerase-like protein (cupin superfamily)|tara:strand:+ start:830 stop:1300 length:471 start_codon:yes stop_codon:yes gene_type:complete